jgi:CubicO group peptidase (beta-lactamase class C family)
VALRTRRLVALLAGLALVGIAHESRVRVAAADRRDVSALLRPIREKHDLPGLAAVVVRGDRVVASGACGVRRRGGTEPLTVDDRFHLGSCTKSMTATLIATLVHEKKLDWTTTVGQVFTDLPKMHPDWQNVRLEQLLTNRGGVPNDLSRDGLWGKLWSLTGRPPREQRRALVEGVLGAPPEAPPGSKFIYSNAGFSIAGAMAERVTGESWEALMKERLFEPLGMETAGFGPPGKKGQDPAPWGHRADGTPVSPDDPGADNPAAIGPAGIVHCALGDWAKYVSLHLRFDGDGCHRPPRGSEKVLALLGPLAFAKLHAVPEGAETRYAMGWAVEDRDWAEGRTLTHNGSNTMWFVVAWLAPKRDFAVLVAANQGGDAAAKATDEAAWAVIQDEVKMWH